MKIETRREGPIVVLSPAGRLDGAGAPVLETELIGVARSSGGRAVLDAGRIAYVSSAGLRTLLVGAKACVQAGGELVIAALTPECRAVVEASGLLSVLEYHGAVEAALAASARSRSREGDVELELAERPEGLVTVLSLKGRLDSSGAAALMERVSAVVERGAVRLLLDCTEMDYVNSAGLRALLIGAKACQQEGGAFAIAALAPRCRSVMQMSGFLSVIDYSDTCEAALAMLDRPDGERPRP